MTIFFMGLKYAQNGDEENNNLFNQDTKLVQCVYQYIFWVCIAIAANSVPPPVTLCFQTPSDLSVRVFSNREAASTLLYRLLNDLSRTIVSVRAAQQETTRLKLALNITPEFASCLSGMLSVLQPCLRNINITPLHSQQMDEETQWQARRWLC